MLIDQRHTLILCLAIANDEGEGELPTELEGSEEELAAIKKMLAGVKGVFSKASVKKASSLWQHLLYGSRSFSRP